MLFFYRQRPGSIMHTLGSTYQNDRLWSSQEIARIVCEHVPELAPRMPAYLINSRIVFLREIMFYPSLRKHPCWKSHIRGLRECIPQILRLRPSDGLKTRRKIYALLLACCPDITHIYTRARQRKSLGGYHILPPSRP